MNSQIVPETETPDGVNVVLPISEPGKFTQGSTLRHVVVMATTGSIGLMSIFIVDLLNLFYISWLKQEALTAAVGYAATLVFIFISACVGMMIAVSALVSKALGERNRAKAEKLSTAGLVYIFGFTAIATLLLMPFTEDLLRLLGASGEPLRLGTRFLYITMPSNILLGLGMAFMGILRAVGDARRGMWVTLGGGLATAFLDPLFIFVFKMGLDGAAIVMVLARVILVLIGGYAVFFVHKLITRPRRDDFKSCFMPISNIAIPAILTNIATPISGGYVTSAIAAHGDAAVAAWAVINRLIPVAFGAIFALSGAIGPILGQNLGAKLFDRIRAVMRDSLFLILGYVMLTWGLLYLAENQIVSLFALSGEAAELVIYYCQVVAGTFVFLGALFVANAAFNNLGFPLMSTFFNWGRATIGTIPFVIYFGEHYGAKGVLLGQGIGALAFGTAAILASFLAVRRLEAKAKTSNPS